MLDLTKINFNEKPLTKEILKELFCFETTNWFNCGDCKYKKGIVCCPEESNCQVDKEYRNWLEDNLIAVLYYCNSDINKKT